MSKQFPAWLIVAALATSPAFGEDDRADQSADNSPQSQTAASASTTPSEAETPEDPLQIYEEVEVRERADDLLGLATSAAEGSVGRLDLARRPILRPGELIETAPGVVATQHSGGGKANQFFVRGFNLDHGTDFSLSVDGIQVNMPTHGHGQGYADLNFLIPEMVDRVRYRKGPYYADVGDFSAAGSADMQLRNSLDEGMIQVTGGSYDYGRVLWAEGWKLGDGEVVAAVDLFNEDGPWTREQEYQGYKGLLRYTAGDAMRGHSITLMGYDADWLSTDQVPLRAVDSGQIGRFDLIDEGPRGNTERFSLSAKVHRGTSNSYSELSAYVLSYDFGLISNFTYFLEDPELGDQFEQLDDRTVFGVDVKRTQAATWGDRRVEIGYGAGVRFDDIENGLFRTSDLVRTQTVRSDRIEQLQGGVWSDVLVHWGGGLRTRLGLRGDAVNVDVNSDLAINSGTETDFQLSPKLSAIWEATDSTEFSLNLGYGFHSNDARGAVILVDPTSGDPATRVEPLVRAKGADIGLRTLLGSDLHTTFTVFVLELDSELVFVGDGGATEASRPSRRQGIEWANFYRASDKVSLELDVTLTDAEFTDDAPEGNEIPGAVGTTIAAGLSVEDLFTSQVGSLRGSLRWRYFGDVPLIEDGSAEWSSSSVVNARLGFRFARGFDLVLDVFNLLDSNDSDIEYFYASRLPGEIAGGIEDIHFHPMESRSARLSLTWRH
ncbi:MAG: TonB-dependent receptor [Acidobacteriota bacterium]